VKLLRSDPAAWCGVAGHEPNMAGRSPGAPPDGGSVNNTIGPGGANSRSLRLGELSDKFTGNS
jgi:hypothetical protein